MAAFYTLTKLWFDPIYKVSYEIEDWGSRVKERIVFTEEVKLYEFGIGMRLTNCEYKDSYRAVLNN